MLRPVLFTAALVVGLVVIYLSLKPAVALGSSDKLAHAAAYFTWTFLAAIAPRRKRWSLVLAGMIFVIGILIELVQPLVGRSCSIYDVLANSAGIVVGLGMALLLHPIRLKLGEVLSRSVSRRFQGRST